MGSVWVWAGNVRDYEEGPTLRQLCDCSYYWDCPMAWLGDRTLAVGGIGSDNYEMLDGARLFDVETGQELTAFAGPHGRFFSDGRWLYSADETGFSRWDPKDGALTGHLPGFSPTRRHPNGTFAQVVGSKLVLWRDTP